MSNKVFNLKKQCEWEAIAHPYCFSRLGHIDLLGKKPDKFEGNFDINNSKYFVNYPKMGFSGIAQFYYDIPNVFTVNNSFYKEPICKKEIFNVYQKAIAKVYSHNLNKNYLKALSVQYKLIDFKYESYRTDPFFNLIPNVEDTKMVWCIYFSSEFAGNPFIMININNPYFKIYLSVGLFIWNSDMGLWENANSGENLLPFQVLYYNRETRYMPMIPKDLLKHPALRCCYID